MMAVPTSLNVMIINNNSNVLEFDCVVEVMEKSKTALMAIPTIEFQKYFESWIKCWHKCVAVDGEYFEEDNITFDE
ncbi:hypothetical protein ALC60_07146 [Trachymyrmex zeteki]|uniref:Uncharacterized protein n=1 Tax=Mycetomoellerius zeteki TaxID=64791 RepID=A0A151X0N5_9HYME|nr:hypothetical protein ALC60_07146 [Trachymyrmex zeteki]